MAAPYSEGFHAIAILYPAPGKFDEVLQEVQDIVEYSLEQEPGTIKFVVSRGFPSGVTDPNLEEISFSEIYANQEAFDIHRSSAKIAKLVDPSRGLLTRGPDIRFTNVVGGFDKTRGKYPA